MSEIQTVKELFISVFTIEPWNDDWSDKKQLDLYLFDLMGQSNSLTYGLFENDELIAVSMGYTKHWYTGTEYCIDELCVRKDKQGKGVGALFVSEIEEDMEKLGLVQIFLQTENNVPAYDFYKKNGFCELNEHVSFAKQI